MTKCVKFKLRALVCTSCYQSGIYCWYGNTEQQQGLIGEVNRGSSRNCQVEVTSKIEQSCISWTSYLFTWWGCRVLTSIRQSSHIHWHLIFQSTSLEIYWHHKTSGIQTGLEIPGFGAKCRAECTSAFPWGFFVQAQLYKPTIYFFFLSNKPRIIGLKM